MGKTKSYYLDDQIVETIDEHAKNSGLSASNTLEHIVATWHIIWLTNKEAVIKAVGFIATEKARKM